MQIWGIKIADICLCWVSSWLGWFPTSTGIVGLEVVGGPLKAMSLWGEERNAPVAETLSKFKCIYIGGINFTPPKGAGPINKQAEYAIATSILPHRGWGLSMARFSLFSKYFQGKIQLFN